ncbi:MAG: fibronectin type III domain-containing protein [Lachnospiraceae bacterium]|nr:fibronectin type III domain-containing protein [Lachnospiraceae bacterium]
MKKRILKTGIAYVSAFIMAVSVLGGVMGSTATVQAEEVEIADPRIAEDGTVTWDKVTFGHYPQEAQFSEELIKWRILSVSEDGTDAFLLADTALDCKQYNSKKITGLDEDGELYTDYSCTWETCTLREWLNDTEDSASFISTAFTPEEQEAINYTNVVNNDNAASDTDGGNDTMDKVYLLSLEEALNSSYGLDEELTIGPINKYNKTRQSEVSDYAILNGAERTHDHLTIYNGKTDWWLRSPGDGGDHAAAVGVNGMANSSGNYVNVDRYAVRPVLHINLQSSSCFSYAGKVDSEGNVTNVGTKVTKLSDPVKDDTGVMTWDCIYFGKYNQNATFDNKQPIEWRVLSVDGDDAFLLADRIIGYKKYNVADMTVENWSTVNWDKCTLRKWLNDEEDSDSFIKTAFSAEEIQAIKETTVVNKDNPVTGTDGGNDTTDKIYLLSVDEAAAGSYGFGGNISEYNKARIAMTTDYADINDRMSGSDTGRWSWWLRTVGRESDDTANILGGSIYANGSYSGEYYGVRPVLHVDLRSDYVKPVGTVSSDWYDAVENKKAQEKADEVIQLISDIGTVSKDSKTAISIARQSYDALPLNARSLVTNYNVLQAAESKYEEMTKDDSGSSDVNDNNGNGDGENGGTGNNNGRGGSGSESTGNNNVSGGSGSESTSNNGNNTTTTASPTPATTEASAVVATTEQTITKPAKVSISSAKKSKKKKIVIKWKKVKNAKGYQIQYATNKKFTQNSKKATSGKLEYVITKLKKGKTYYVRVRAYSQGTDGNKVYGKWSSVKKVRK